MVSFFPTLQDKMEITASIECFITLRTKSFTIIPDCLTKAMRKELTATAREIYRELYGLAEKTWNSKAKRLPVIISASTLAKRLFKSERTIKRRLAELESKGFIKIKHRFDKQNRSQISNAIWPMIPAYLVQELLADPDRKNLCKTKASENSVNSTEQKKSLSEDKSTAEIENYSCMPYNGLEHMQPTISENVDVTPERQAYERYNKLVATLQAEGLSIAKANMMAYQKLNKEQKKIFTKYLEQEASKEKNFAIKQAQATSSAPHDKIVTHKIYYNYIVNSNSSVDNYGAETSTNALAKPLVNLNKIITPEFIVNEICKLKRKNQIPPIIFNQGRTIDDIVLEVQFHVEHRDLNKTKTALHAVNAAKSLLIRGLWRTPKKYAYMKNTQAIAREQLATKGKACELIELRQFINNTSKHAAFNGNSFQSNKNAGFYRENASGCKG